MMGDEGCDHPVQLHGMCAVCGQELTDDQTTNSFLTSHSNATVKVSAAEAQRLDDETTAHLLSSRRLALIVDLDQTIIHATVEETVGAWMRDPTNPNNAALSDVGYFQLDIEGKTMPLSSPSGQSEEGEGANGLAEQARPGHWYYVKPRPGLPAFLQELSQIFELHVYTMGTRSYADNVCRLVDPTGRLFGSRILSRDENGSMAQKSLSRLFPVDTSMVVIIDDRADVWSWSPNLVKVIPFNFFPGTGDINGAFLPSQPPPPAAPTVATQTSSAESSSPAPSVPSSSSTTPQDSNSATSQSSLEAEEAATRAQQGELADKKPLAKMQEALDEKRREAIAQVVDQSSEDGQPGSDTEKEANEEESSKGVGPSQLTNATGAASIEEIEEKAEEIAAEPGLASSPAQAAAAETLAHTPKAILNTDDRELVRLKTLLEEIHRRWYTEWDRRVAAASIPLPPIPGTNLPSQQAAPAIRPEAMGIIATLKKSVLAGCGIVFSSVIPLGQAPQTSESWIMAEEFGARCHVNIERSVTHVVAAKPGTAKVNQAQRSARMHAVWPSWLTDSIARWERQPESSYILPDMPTLGSAPENEGTWRDGGDDETEEEFDPGSEGGEDINFTGVDWANVDAEVDAFLDGSDDDDDSETDGYASDNSRTSKSARKRARVSAASAAGDQEGGGDESSNGGKQDASGSPLSKRRKVAEAARTGGSALKHQVAPDDSTESEGGAGEGDAEDESKVNGHNAPTPGGNLTDSSEADQSLLDDFANEMEAQLGEGDE